MYGGNYQYDKQAQNVFPLCSSDGSVRRRNYSCQCRQHYQKHSGSYPVVVLLDADYTFSLLQNIAWFLADENELRPLILVGIASPGAAQEKHGPIMKLNRTRDFTPTHVATGGYGAEFQKASGGADKFLDFIEQELIPHLEQNYRVKHDDRTILGLSFGGLLASYALWTRPGLFQRFIIISPSLWYDKRFVPALLDRPTFAKKDLRARVFFSVGANETAAKGSENMVRDLTLFVNKLDKRNYPNFKALLWVAEGESHHSVLPLVGCLSPGYS